MTNDLKTSTIANLDESLDGRVIRPGRARVRRSRVRSSTAGTTCVRRSSCAQRATTTSRGPSGSPRRPGSSSPSEAAGHSGAGHGSTDGGIQLDLADMRGLEIDVEDATAWVGSGLTAAEYTVATGSSRPRDRVRGHRLGRHRRDHAGRRRRLPRSQVRPDDRQPARRRRRDRRRRDRARRRRDGAGPVLGDPRRRRQLRRRDPAAVPAATGRHGRGRHAVPARHARGRSPASSRRRRRRPTSSPRSRT